MSPERRTPTTTQPPPAIGNDLASYLAQNDIQANIGGPSADPDDPPVLMRRNRTQRVGGGFAPTLRRRTRNERTTLSEAMRGFYRMSPTQVRDLQQRLLRGGFFGAAEEADISWGIHDEDTAKAYERAVTRAAAYFDASQHLSVDDVIDRSSRPASDADGGRERAPLTVRLTNPEDLGTIAENAYRKALGRKPTAAEAKAFVTAYQGQESTAQRTAYGQAETGGTMTDAPDPSVAAVNAARRGAPVEAGAHDIAMTADDWLGLLKGRG